ncbi:MAG: hypothetical protein KBT14_00870 [Proteobacteria bacterium]|nr:hypothetical protein [Candidatus Enterousia onthequi]
MKKSLFGFCAVLGCVAALDASAATGRSAVYSSIDMRNADGDTIRINRSASESYSNDFDRRVPGRTTTTSRSGMYDGMTSGYTRHVEPVAVSEHKMVSKRTYLPGKTYKSAKRKYFIANPFYQPLQGRFGAVTTGEYMQGTYKFADVDRTLTEMSIKEDFSYGLTDRIALQGMAKYNSDKLSWKNSLGVEDVNKGHSLNLYGLGIQGRIVDTDEWISTLSGYYEHQKHGVDYFIADLKAGYKVATSTIYGLGRVWAVDMEGDIYGDYMEDATTWAMLKYGNADDTLLMGELGMGVWTVLAEDWTLNVEGVFGAYDWHNQFSIKGAFGWQPNDNFALNLYAKTSLYDSADGKDLDLYYGNLPLNATNWAAATLYNVELSKVQEWSVGLQVMFQF